MRNSRATIALSPQASTLRQAFRIDEAAEILACSRRHIYNYIESGALTAIRLSNSIASVNHSHMRVTRASIDQFLNDPKRRVI